MTLGFNSRHVSVRSLFVCRRHEHSVNSVGSVPDATQDKFGYVYLWHTIGSVNNLWVCVILNGHIIALSQTTWNFLMLTIYFPVFLSFQTASSCGNWPKRDSVLIFFKACPHPSSHTTSCFFSSQEHNGGFVWKIITRHVVETEVKWGGVKLFDGAANKSKIFPAAPSGGEGFFPLSDRPSAYGQRNYACPANWSHFLHSQEIKRPLLRRWLEPGLGGKMDHKTWPLSYPSRTRSPWYEALIRDSIGSASCSWELLTTDPRNTRLNIAVTFSLDTELYSQFIILCPFLPLYS